MDVGGNPFRVFNVGDGNADNFFDVTIDGLAITGGNAEDARVGGIGNVGDLTVIDSTVSGNSAIALGGIYNGGDMTVTNSTLAI